MNIPRSLLPTPHSPLPTRRSFATLLVLWVVAFAVVVLATVESAAYRQSAAGREALSRVRARWAARAGVEAAIARIESYTQTPDQFNAYALIDELGGAAEGTLDGAAFRASYTGLAGEVLGAQDAHAKLNINSMTTEQLMLLPYMTEDMADAILDWIDSDDDVRPLGAESAFYSSTTYPYEARNSAFRTMAELELIQGVTPEMVRGEDWNLNGLLDENEDDGDASWPPDNADGKLDDGWTKWVTASSLDGGLGASGQSRLDLTLATTTADVLVQRLGVDSTQADVILSHGQASGAAMADFIRRGLDQLVAPQGGGSPIAPPARLTNDQLAALLAECSIGTPASPAPGKLNINTCDAEVLEYLPQIDAATADAVMLERESRPNGFNSIVDLLDIPGMTRARLATLYPLVDVRSNVFIVTVRGRDAATGLESQIVATIDRSTLPCVIRELRQ